MSSMKFSVFTTVAACFVFCWVGCESFAFSQTLVGPSRSTTTRRSAFLNKNEHVTNRHLDDEAGTPSVQLNRRDVLSMAGLVGAMWPTAPSMASASRYVLDEETGDYVEIEEADWQTAWKQRLDKASSMSTDEIFQAARGAGNLDLRTGPESDASKKRRAMSACRDASVRNKVGAGSEIDCTARVFAGEFDFILDAL